MKTNRYSIWTTIPDFERSYRAETQELLVERLRLALTVGGILYALFGVLDLAVAPERFGSFAAIRGVVVAMSALTVLATYTVIGRKHVLALSVQILVVASLGITVMTTQLDGFASDYYIGNMLVLFYVGLFMPWPIRVTVTFCILLCAPYFALNLWFFGMSREVIPAAFFLFGTSAFTCVATIAGDRRRRRDLALRLKLEVANNELKELNQMKSRFFANVSHELRTPLMLILGPLESMLRGVDEHGDPKALLETMAANAHRLLRQVNMLLDFARFEAGRVTCDFAEASVGAVIQKLVWSATPYAKRRGIQLESRGLDGLPVSVFDREKVETVIANLLSNALKFTDHGGTIEVHARANEENILIEVRDTGVGIPQDQLELVFDRFHQVDSSLARKAEGTGLGLSLARELVMLHGGRISVRSKLGHGSTFCVELPRVPREAVQDRRRGARRREDRMTQVYLDTVLAEQLEMNTGVKTLLADLEGVVHQSGPPSEIPPGPLSAPRLLVVEDNGDLRNFVARAMAKTYRVRTAQDGFEGLEIAHQEKPDLIISDVMMPRMDGYEFCRQLRSDSSLANTPIILLTAKAGADSLVDGLGVGADDYVTKPFDMRELESRVAAHLRAKKIEKHLRDLNQRLAVIGQMTGSIIHDLRGPLTAIIGHTELALLTSGAGDDTLQSDLSAVKEATCRVIRMTEEVVEFSRGTQLKLSKQPVELGGFATAIANECRKGLEAAGISLVVEHAEKESWGLIDQDRMRRVLENLLANAKEALIDWGEKARAKRIWVDVRSKDSSVVIRVADNGPGIPEELAHRLFEPFATSRKKNGTGLGLAIVRDLVEAHGGTIEVERRSAEGGAAFTIVIEGVEGEVHKVVTPVQRFSGMRFRPSNRNHGASELSERNPRSR